MSVSDADIAGALELFDALGDLTTRKMMGGLCLYHDGTIFALEIITMLFCVIFCFFQLKFS